MKLPNFDKATIRPHLSAAQYGQYSAPMYRTSGVPPLVRSGQNSGVRWVTPLEPTETRVELPTPDS